MILHFKIRLATVIISLLVLLYLFSIENLNNVIKKNLYFTES